MLPFKVIQPLNFSICPRLRSSHLMTYHTVSVYLEFGDREEIVIFTDDDSDLRTIGLKGTVK
jgi:hypothetical protein